VIHGVCRTSVKQLLCHDINTGHRCNVDILT